MKEKWRKFYDKRGQWKMTWGGLFDSGCQYPKYCRLCGRKTFGIPLIWHISPCSEVGPIGGTQHDKDYAQGLTDSQILEKYKMPPRSLDTL